MENKKIVRQDKIAAVVIMLMFAGFIFLVGKVYTSLNVDNGKIDAERILSTMTKGERLPWSSNESRTLAVLECDEATIFINSKMERVGSWAEGCEYHVARDVKVILDSKLFSPTGQIRFEPKN